MMNRYKYVKARHSEEDRLRRESEEWVSKLQKIKEHPETRAYTRKDFEPAYKYVEEMFPELASAIAATVIYKNPNTYFCQNKKGVGLPKNVGGVYMIKVGAILVCHSTIPDDVIVVHEMLHFASNMLGSRLKNAAAEEDFAFCRSIPYIVQQGASKEWIAKRYLLPYYTNREWDLMHDRREKPNEELAKSRALEKAYLRIENPLGERIEDAPFLEDEDRFGMI